ncbi:MAG: hypothetical protein EOO43_09010, partial [Flavobacterium sp.]
MDNMTYTYKANKNQLDKVVDAAADASVANYPNYNDIKQGQANGNYTYDEIGNLKTDVSEGITNISWNVYGKVQTISKSGSAISYTYDAAGNRISKTYNNKSTWYVRDAIGNVMSTYITDASINSGDLTQSEIHLYGSSRLGVLNVKTNVQNIVNSNGMFSFERTNKFFELTNHLGNVLVLLSDKKIAVDGNIDGNIDYYTTDIITANDYASGGMQMPLRKYNNSHSSYRYGFNGQEKSDEIFAGLTTAMFWEYDSRIVKRWNIDPKSAVAESPYLCFKGNPILLSDVNGDKPGGTEDPTPVYHRTTSENAASILKNGFDPTKSKREGFTYFMLDPAKQSIGKNPASGNALISANVDISNAKQITKGQMTQWFNEGLNTANSQLNTKYSSMTDIPKELQPKYQGIADGVRNSKLAEFMKNDGGSIYNIQGKNTIAVSEGAIGSVKVEGITGQGASKAMVSSGLKFKASIRTVGTVFVLLAVAHSAYTVANSPTPVREAVTEGAGWAGATYGATTGAAAWSVGGPWGAAAGGAVGGAMGYFVGKNGSDIMLNAGGIVRDAVQDYNKSHPIEKPGNLIYHLCFKKGTLVYGKNKLERIENIRPGDTVFSYNFEKDKIELSKVLDVASRQTDTLHRITTTEGTIEVTAEHPFYVLR